ncbi:zinc-binding alcohol dehydrogenase family protein [Streptomyces sp. NPDC020490]|uniref:zinc-binding alcohol dehydrogenase family protein n=1 Tax=Streptomyces sp. NPDC020490 TaxID=3365078 RepID=UPI00379D9024
MRAIVVSEDGRMTPARVEEPVPGPGEVAIEVAYAGVNFSDVMDRRRLYGHGLPGEFIAGLEVSGHVRALGSDVGHVQVGQPVVAFCRFGGYAEVALAPASLVVPLSPFPAVSLDVAAALPTSMATAHLLLTAVTRVSAGESLLMHAAAGGTGTAVALLARRLGVGPLIGTVGSQEKRDHALRAGYDEVYLRQGFSSTVLEATHGRGVDVVFESIGGATQSDNLSVLAAMGRMAVMGNTVGLDTVDLRPRDLLVNNVSVAGFSLTSLSRSCPGMVTQAIRDVLGFVESGEVRFELSDMVSLDKAPELIDKLASGQTTGKHVVRVG